MTEKVGRLGYHQGLSTRSYFSHDEIERDPCKAALLLWTAHRGSGAAVLFPNPRANPGRWRLERDRPGIVFGSAANPPGWANGHGTPDIDRPSAHHFTVLDAAGEADPYRCRIPETGPNGSERAPVPGCVPETSACSSSLAGEQGCWSVEVPSAVRAETASSLQSSTPDHAAPTSSPATSSRGREPEPRRIRRAGRFLPLESSFSRAVRPTQRRRAPVSADGYPLCRRFGDGGFGRRPRLAMRRQGAPILLGKILRIDSATITRHAGPGYAIRPDTPFLPAGNPAARREDLGGLSGCAFRGGFSFDRKNRGAICGSADGGTGRWRGKPFLFFAARIDSRPAQGGVGRGRGGGQTSPAGTIHGKGASATPPGLPGRHLPALRLRATKPPAPVGWVRTTRAGCSVNRAATVSRSALPLPQRLRQHLLRGGTLQRPPHLDAGTAGGAGWQSAAILRAGWRRSPPSAKGEADGREINLRGRAFEGQPLPHRAAGVRSTQRPGPLRSRRRPASDFKESRQHRRVRGRSQPRLRHRQKGGQISPSPVTGTATPQTTPGSNPKARPTPSVSRTSCSRAQPGRSSSPSNATVPTPPISPIEELETADRQRHHRASTIQRTATFYLKEHTLTRQAAYGPRLPLRRRRGSRLGWGRFARGATGTATAGNGGSGPRRTSRGRGLFFLRNALTAGLKQASVGPLRPRARPDPSDRLGTARHNAARTGKRTGIASMGTGEAELLLKNLLAAGAGGTSRSRFGTRGSGQGSAVGREW